MFLFVVISFTFTKLRVNDFCVRGEQSSAPVCCYTTVLLRAYDYLVVGCTTICLIIKQCVSCAHLSRDSSSRTQCFELKKSFLTANVHKDNNSRRGKSVHDSLITITITAELVMYMYMSYVILYVYVYVYYLLRIYIYYIII
jgi:hypothetical protein